MGTPHYPTNPNPNPNFNPNVDLARQRPMAPTAQVPFEDAETAAQDLYDQLLPYAQREWREFFISRAPASCAEAMLELVNTKMPEEELPPLPAGPPSDPPTENAIGQYAAQRAAAKAAASQVDEVRAEMVPASTEPPPTAPVEPQQPPQQPTFPQQPGQLPSPR
jgi:hypothetical protein